VEYQLSARRGRIYALGQRYEPDPAAFQGFDQRYQMHDRTPETVKSPYDQNIATPEGFQHGRQAITLLLTSRYAVVFGNTVTPRET